MAIMDRLSRLIRANVNDLIDRAEDPEKMLEQILRDMQTNITQARAQVASMIAQEKELEADLDETTRLSDQWGEKAKRAVDAGKDDLAREALRRKRDNDENAKVYQQQLTVQEQTVNKLKDQLRQLEAKYQSTLSQKDTLIARQRRARAQTKVAETLSTFSPLDPTADLDRMERQIRTNEAKAAAMVEMGDTSYDAQFRELDYDADIEAELDRLKAGGEAPTAALGQGETSSASSATSTSSGDTDEAETASASSSSSPSQSQSQSQSHGS
jgi:phage shock protein A